jgi:hypothetical protein
MSSDEREKARQSMRADMEYEKEAMARGVYILPFRASDQKLQRKILRIAVIARSVAQTPILTKRRDGRTGELRNDEDVVGKEDATYRSLIQAFIQPQDLEEER